MWISSGHCNQMMLVLSSELTALYFGLEVVFSGYTDKFLINPTSSDILLHKCMYF